jgi:alcohol dehydrogenase
MNIPEASLAAILHAAQQPFDIRPVRIPALQQGECLVRVEACTICASDLHTYAGRRDAPMPIILGHEMVGSLVWPTALQDGAGMPLHAGERLVWSLASGCHHCLFCKSLIPQKCTSLFKYGHERFAEPWTLNGGLAEYCVLRAGSYLRGIADNLDANLAAPASCATATVAAAIRAAGDVAGKHVAVLGAGMLGVTACAMLDTLGAHVIAIDIQADRLQLATRFGASAVVDAGLPFQDVTSRIFELTGGYGADAVLELAGVNSSVERALQATRTGGTCVLVGSVFPQPPIPFNAEDFVRRLITLKGVHNYAPADLDRAVEFLSLHAHRYPFQTLVAASFPLQSVDQAFQYASSSGAYRVSVEP